jgi:hypothetical protein
MIKRNNKKESGEISRREFLKDAGLILGGATLGSTVLLSACGGGETTTETVTQTETVATTQTVSITPGAEQITVLTPTGYFEPVELKQLTPRPDSLDGKKIYLVDITFSGSYDLAAEMYNWFKDNKPELDVTVTTEVGSFNAAREDETWSMIKDNNGVAAIIGGH